MCPDANGLHGGLTMTFEQCQANLAAIRRKQGTDRPEIRVDYGGTAYRGRLARSDSDRPDGGSPYGLLVLESPGLDRGPETILQIANIPPGGIRDVSEN
jgi:hypothetical protein